MHMHRTTLLSLFLILSTVSAHADELERGPAALKGLKFRNIGPAAGGRVSRAAGVPGDPLTYYAATAASGIWKSTDGGIRWKPIADDLSTSTFGSLAIAPSDANVLYAGSGEANIRGNVEVGNGIYKSSDGGKTWKHVWKQEGQIGTLVVHPKNADIAYAAVLGKAFGPNAERGVYRTTDGGTSWKRVLFKSNNAGAGDVALDPNNPRILFAALWQTRRRPWEMTSGGPDSGLYVSRDGGDSWTQLVPKPADDKPEAEKPAAAGSKRCDGLPDGPWGRIGLAVAPSNSKRIYALIEAEKGGLYRSDDGGDSWELVNANKGIRQRPWYFSTLTVDPANADVIYFPNVPLLKSIDGGKTLTRVKGTHHGDHHDLWIDPKNPARMIDSNDGGVDISTDGGKTWYAPPLPIAQLYHIDVDNATPYRVACTMQDIGTARGPSRSLLGGSIALSEWRTVGGGEAGHVACHPTDSHLVYAGEYMGYISRYDDRHRQARSIGIYPITSSGMGAEALKYRFQWTAPILISPHDSRVLYHAGNVLFRTDDEGKSWKAISKDLTRDDKSKQKWSGGPITGDNTGVETYCTIFALAESPKQKGLIWAGSDDGLVHVTADGGTTWTNVTAGLSRLGLPEWGTVCCIEPSAHEADTAYVVVDGHRMDDRKPHLFVTRDRGKTWIRLTEKMPDYGFLSVVREDPKKKGLLYVGAEQGLLYSLNGGETWEKLQLNFPTVRVSDLKVKNDDLVVGTNGRSIWILDDLTPLRTMSKELAAKDVHVFAPPVAVRYRTGYTYGNDQPMNGGDNRPAGAMLTYRLGKTAKEVTLTVRDGKGSIVRKLSSKKEEEEESDIGGYSDPNDSKTLPKKAGLHRVEWDLHQDGSERIRGAKLDSGNPRVGPLAVPGLYTLELEADGKKMSVPLEVTYDPRQKGAKAGGELVSLADLEEQAKIALQLRDDITRLARIGNSLRSVKKQAAGREKLLGKDEKMKGLLEETKALVKKLDALEEKLHNPRAETAYDILAQKGGAKLYSQLVWLFEQIKDADGVPGQGWREAYADKSAELKTLSVEWEKLLKEDLATLNAKAKTLDAPVLIAR